MVGRNIPRKCLICAVSTIHNYPLCPPNFSTKLPYCKPCFVFGACHFGSSKNSTTDKQTTPWMASEPSELDQIRSWKTSKTFNMALASFLSCDELENDSWCQHRCLVNIQRNVENPPFLDHFSRETMNCLHLCWFTRVSAGNLVANVHFQMIFHYTPYLSIAMCLITGLFLRLQVK